MSLILKEWKNKDLAVFFENVTPDFLKEYSIRGGLENGCDIEQLFSLIEKTQSVIEIGACYGRVIRHLLRKNYQGKIYAIERSKNLFNYLKQSFPSTSQVRLINQDIIDFMPEEPVDAILWLWSDISGFAKQEQLEVLRHVSSWLKPDGILIIETLLHTLTALNASETKGQEYCLESEYGTAYGYIPSESEINFYGETLGFKKIDHIHYFTSTGRERILNLLSSRIF